MILTEMTRTEIKDMIIEALNDYNSISEQNTITSKTKNFANLDHSNIFLKLIAPYLDTDEAIEFSYLHNIAKEKYDIKYSIAIFVRELRKYCQNKVKYLTYTLIKGRNRKLGYFKFYMQDIETLKKDFFYITNLTNVTKVSCNFDIFNNCFKEQSK